MLHPNDDNGDVLRRMEANGDDLSRARNIDFTIVFPNQFSSEEFATHFRREGYKVAIEHAEVKEKHPWDVVVVKYMIPSHADITDFEQQLQEVAETLGGYNDGWGCFSQPSKHLQ